jgi:raffinose/stachyose/melibiose transport system substrate-binding protein
MTNPSTNCKKSSRPRWRRSAATLAALGLTLAACGDDDDAADEPEAPTTEASGTDGTDGTEAPAAEGTEAAATEPAESDTAEPTGDAVTIDWWHIQNTEPSQSNWQAVADQLEAEHPGVQIEVTVMENEAFKAAIQTNMQAGDVPDLFQSWGGGGLLQQVDAGLVQDISGEVADVAGDLTGTGSFEIDGALYGLPWKVGMVGIWYNADLFAEAGLDAPADTWEGLLEQVQTLKDAGITPIAVGAGDKWPAHIR